MDHRESDTENRSAGRRELEPSAFRLSRFFPRTFRTAVAFLTRLPVDDAGRTSGDLLQRSTVYFPVVGALIGAGSAGVLVAAGALWPAWLAVVLALAAETWLTGGLHEDALADCCDAFGGGWTREDVQRILKDSRLGVYGTLGLLGGVLLKAGALYALVERVGLPNWWLWGSVLVAAGALSRSAMVLAPAILPPVADRASLAQGFDVQTPGFSEKPGVFPLRIWGTSLAALLAVVPFAVLMPVRFVLSVAAGALAAWWLLALFRRRLGGVTGDCVGSLGYVMQVLVLLAAAARSGT